MNEEQLKLAAWPAVVADSATTEVGQRTATLKLWFVESGDLFHETAFDGDDAAAIAIAQEQAGLAFCDVRWAIVDASGETLDSGTVENGCIP